MSKILQAVLKDTKIVTNVTPAACHIGTHDGSFHCDEVLAISMLKCLPQYKDAVVVRTRNLDILSQCNIVVDVGAKYEPKNHKYDHHQREFQGTIDNFKTRLSSAGLVYKHFGNEILSTIVSNSVPISNADHNRLCTILYEKIYKGFVEHIDGIDNGIEVATGEINYNISTSLSSRVGHLLPAWNEPNSNDIINSRFTDALQMVGSEFYASVDRLVNVWWPARSLVEGAVEARKDVHPSQRIMVMPCSCPWKDHIFDIEKDLAINSISIPTFYVLFEDTSSHNWRIQAVPQTPTSFSSRKSLPKAWCGLRDDVLSKESGIDGCIFIHASGFIGGNQTKEGAIQMAIKALEMDLE